MCVNVFMCVYKGRAMLKRPGRVRGQVAGMREFVRFVRRCFRSVCVQAGGEVRI